MFCRVLIICTDKRYLVRSKIIFYDGHGQFAENSNKGPSTPYRYLRSKRKKNVQHLTVGTVLVPCFEPFCLLRWSGRVLQLPELAQQAVEKVPLRGEICQSCARQDA